MATDRKLLISESGKLLISESGQLADKDCCCGKCLCSNNYFQFWDYYDIGDGGPPPGYNGIVHICLRMQAFNFDGGVSDLHSYRMFHGLYSEGRSLDFDPDPGIPYESSWCYDRELFNTLGRPPEAIDFWFTPSGEAVDELLYSDLTWPEGSEPPGSGSFGVTLFEEFHRPFNTPPDPPEGEPRGEREWGEENESLPKILWACWGTKFKEDDFE